MDEEKTHEEDPQEGEGPGPVDPLTERLEFKALALEHARRALRPSAMFGTGTPNSEDLIFVADWLLDEMSEGQPRGVCEHSPTGSWDDPPCTCYIYRTE